MKNAEKISGNSTNDNFTPQPVELIAEEAQISMDAQHYAEIYKELAGLIGENNTRKIWQQYHGQAVQFPQRLYSREYTHAFIRENEGIIKPREMAQTLGLTERRVRQIIQKMREEEEGKGRQEPAE